MRQLRGHPVHALSASAALALRVPLKRLDRWPAHACCQVNSPRATCVSCMLLPGILHMRMVPKAKDFFCDVLGVCMLCQRAMLETGRVHRRWLKLNTQYKDSSSSIMRRMQHIARLSTSMLRQVHATRTVPKTNEQQQSTAVGKV